MSDFAEYKAAITANDTAAAAAIADPPEHAEETTEPQPADGGENSAEQERREQTENARKPEVKRDWRDGKIPAGVQKRFDKITAEKYELQQRAERAEALLKEREAQSRPTQENGEIKRESTQELAARLQREKVGTDSASKKPDFDDPIVQQRIAEGRQRYPDWDQAFESARKNNIQIPVVAIEAAAKLPNHVDVTYVLAKNPALAAELLTTPEKSVAVVQELGRGLQVLSAVQEALADFDNGPAVWQHFKKNPELEHKVSRMTPAQAYKAVVKLAAQLETGRGREKPTTKAPEPITPVSTGRAIGDFEIPLDQMSLADYKKARAGGRI